MPTRLTPKAALLLGLAVAGCDVNIHEGKASLGVFSAEARQEWTHEYPLSVNGEVEIANLNGPIELSQGAAGAVEVHADITAKALTDGTARDTLLKGRIEETASPERVAVETVAPRGVHGSYEVRYRVRVPPQADIRVSTTNGSVTATGLSSKLKASVSNGSIHLTDMAGAVDAACVNGSLSATLAQVTAPIRLEMTNGRLNLEFPKGSAANLTARVVNGGLSVSGLLVEEPRGTRIRNLEATLNGGGPAIDVRTTNGRMTIEGK
jgi:hypothetical protein